MVDSRSSDPNWADVAQRTVTFAKQGASSLLLVTYQDTFGAMETGTTTTCRWRLVVDGTAAGREQWNYSDVQRGWQISSRTVNWLLPGVAAGSHTAKVQVARGPGAAYCLNGFENNQQENFLLVQELSTGE